MGEEFYVVIYWALCSSGQPQWSSPCHHWNYLSTILPEEKVAKKGLFLLFAQWRLLLKLANDEPRLWNRIVWHYFLKLFLSYGSNRQVHILLHFEIMLSLAYHLAHCLVQRYIMPHIFKYLIIQCICIWVHGAGKSRNSRCMTCSPFMFHCTTLSAGERMTSHLQIYWTAAFCCRPMETASSHDLGLHVMAPLWAIPTPASPSLSWILGHWPSLRRSCFSHPWAQVTGKRQGGNMCLLSKCHSSSLSACPLRTCTVLYMLDIDATEAGGMFALFPCWRVHRLGKQEKAKEK